MVLLKPENWLEPTSGLMPNINEVHIWFVDITKYSIDTKSYGQIFSKLEMQRLKSIITGEKRAKSILRQYLLFKILSCYTRKETKDINLYYSEYGKPFLSSELEKNLVQFNVSNSYNYLLVGVCTKSLIGVDIEKISKKVDYEGLVKRFFTEREKRIFIKLEEKDKEAFFYQWWTIKESVIKAVGMGMRLPINSFEIPFEDQLNQIDIDLTEINKKLFFYTLSLADDCKASFSLERNVEEVKFFQLRPETSNDSIQ